jgi:hypothetical protein
VLPDDKMRATLVSAVVQKWSEKDAAGALMQYQSLGLSDPLLLSHLVERDARIHPAEAAEFLTQLDPAQLLRTGPEVVNDWVQSDPAAALAWALDHGVSVASHPSLTDKVVHDGLERNTMSTFSACFPLAAALDKKPTETLAWIEALPAGPDRNRFIESAMPHLQREQALSLFSSLPPEAAAHAAWAVADQFKKDPAGGEQWASALPVGAAREQAWTALGRTGGDQITPPSGSDRDAYLSGRVNDFNLPATEKLEIAAQISDPTKQRDVFDNVIENFGEQAAKECRKWMDTADAPEDWKVRWRAMLDESAAAKRF